MLRMTIVPDGLTSGLRRYGIRASGFARTINANDTTNSTMPSATAIHPNNSIVHNLPEPASVPSLRPQARGTLGVGTSVRVQQPDDVRDVPADATGANIVQQRDFLRRAVLPLHRPGRDDVRHLMFNQLARDAEWVIDWSQIPGDVFAHARTLAIVEDHTGIDALIRPNLHRTGYASTLTVEQVRSFQARGISRTPDVLDRELDAARRRRHSHPAPEPFSTETRRPEPPAPHGGLSL